MNRKAHILIVDDHPLIREALRASIEQDPALALGGEADGVETALEALRASSPDLVLLDLSLRDGHGLALIKRILALNPGTKILVVSTHEESLYAERVLRMGARGYVEKLAGSAVIIDAIKKVIAGETYLSAQMQKLLPGPWLKQDSDQHPLGHYGLTNREIQVFDLIGEGIALREIARCLHVSVKTVDTHRENIKRKLKIHTALELHKLAMRFHFEKG